MYFRKQTYGDCGIVYHFDYNQWIHNKLKSQSSEKGEDAPSDAELNEVRSHANSLSFACRGMYLHSQNYHRVASIYSLYYKSHQENFKSHQLFEVPLIRNVLSHYDSLNLR